MPAGQLQTRSARKQGFRRPAPRRGYFVDVRTLAGALFGRSFTLADLADFLGLAQGKLQPTSTARRSPLPTSTTCCATSL